MTDQQATVKEQLDLIKDAVETAIMQAAEISGLRNWLIYHHFRNLKQGEWPNEEEILIGEGQSLGMAFEGIVDPDDTDYLDSRWCTECDTEKGINKLEEIAYESEPI